MERCVKPLLYYPDPLLLRLCQFKQTRSSLSRRLRSRKSERNALRYEKTHFVVANCELREVPCNKRGLTARVETRKIQNRKWHTGNTHQF
jgi:hypothetical protein